MLLMIPINYKDLEKMTQTSLFNIGGRQYSITIRKSTISKNCYITIEVDRELICENKSCTCGEFITRGIVDPEKYPEQFYFSYTTDGIGRNFNYDNLGEKLFLFYWDGNEDDINA